MVLSRRQCLSVLAAVFWPRRLLPGKIIGHGDCPGGMRTVADQQALHLGVMVPSAHVSSVLSTNSAYKRECLENFNTIAVPDCGWARVHPDKGIWKLSTVREELSFANAARLEVTAMHMLWGHPSQIPAWVRSLPLSTLKREALEHVSALARACQGHVRTWSVLNEWEGAPWIRGSTFWRDALDIPDLVEVFKGIRNEDPLARLIVNDFAIEVPGLPQFSTQRRDNVLRLITELGSRGASVGGVGFQMHLNAADLSTSDIRDQRMAAFQENVGLFQKSGAEVLVTELDVSVKALDGSVEARLATQAEVYEAVLRSALEAGIKSITFWGLSDKYAIDMESGRVPLGPGPLLFDTSLQPKPAYVAACRALSAHVKQ